MKIVKFATLLILSISSCIQAEMNPETAFNRLTDGNKRFVSDQSIHPDRTAERREETAAKQEPFAAILGCSDSRVSPEILFDQGIGDLFIVRVAGNVVGPIELASLEYSVLYLHSSLVVVLGHENCGAVGAVLEGKSKDIEPIASLIEPAVKKTEKAPGDRLENTIKENVSMVTAELQKNPALKQRIDKGALLIKGGYYNFHSGEVEFLK
ncbi:MAG: carbonic anhydrase [Chlamydiota bacterium]